MSKLTFLNCTVVLAILTLIVTVLSVMFRTDIEVLFEFKFVIGTLFCVNALNILSMSLFADYQLQEKHMGRIIVKGLCLAITFCIHLTV
jgi:hypothetical protein